jgi:2-oxoisovalerate dehydrogenase E1 component beta subunit
VIFLEPKLIYNGPFDGRPDQMPTSWAGHPQSEVPEGHYTVPLGQAATVRPGSEVTLLAYGTMVHVAIAGIEESGIDADLIDDAIVASVRSTGRCVIVHEASRFGGELGSLVQERCFFHLCSPIERVAGWDTPYPRAFEWDYFSGPARVAAALSRAMEN